MQQLTKWKTSQKAMVMAALASCNGNRTHAAKWLGVSVRTIRNKVHEFNLKGKKVSK